MSREELVHRLRQHLAALEGERNPFSAPEGYRRAQAHIAGHLEALGTVEHQPFAAPPAEGLNIVFKPRHESPQVLLGAHYDCVPGSPGADDNASGVAILLEVARLYVEGQARRGVWFAAFDLEEWSMLGSQALARTMAAAGQGLELMISLEMLGYRRQEPGSQRYPPFLGWFYPNRGDFVGLIGNPRSWRQMRRLAACLRDAQVKAKTLIMPFRGQLLPSSRWSDHSPFWDRGYPAVMMTDTAWLRNPNYHRPTDRVDTLDLDFMAGIVVGLCQFLTQAG